MNRPVWLSVRPVLPFEVDALTETVGRYAPRAVRRPAPAFRSAQMAGTIAGWTRSARWIASVNVTSRCCGAPPAAGVCWAWTGREMINATTPVTQRISSALPQAWLWSNPPYDDARPPPRVADAWRAARG